MLRKEKVLEKHLHSIQTQQFNVALPVLNVLLKQDPGATRFAALSTCPWLPYFAPSALRLTFSITGLDVQLHFKLESTNER